jgi:hypothetical protein
VKIANIPSHNWAFRTETTDDETGIPCVTIPDIYDRECSEGATFPFIVKIDIEGAEADVFAQNTDWLKRTPIVMIELHDWLFPKKQTAAGFLRCIADEPRDGGRERDLDRPRFAGDVKRSGPLEPSSPQQTSYLRSIPRLRRSAAPPKARRRRHAFRTS